MKQIKVYNIGKLIKQHIPDKIVHMDNKLAILEGNNGVMIFDPEAVGWKKNSINDTVKIGLTDIPEKGIMYAAPQYQLEVSIAELREAEYEEMGITKFVDRFNYNGRLQNNFSTLLKTINEIGLNSQEYYSK